MAVNINEMDVEVASRQTPQQASPETTAPQEKMNIRQELEKLAERKLRLNVH